MNQFLMTLPDLIILAVFYFLFLFSAWKKNQNLRINTGIYISVILVLYFTLMPVILRIPAFHTGRSSQYNIFPYTDWFHHYGSYRRQSFGNMALFIPFGYCMKAKKKNWFWRIIFIGMVLSFTVEFFQPLISYTRVCDITDLSDNTIGTALGVLLWILMHHLFKPDH